MDYSNCFFYDPVAEVRVCMDDGTSNTCTGNFNMHRKVVSYRYFNGTGCSNPPCDTFAGNAADVAFGHGTHVAGTLAGKAVSDDPSEEEFARKYNGVVPEAKLAIDDLSRQSGYLNMPSELHNGLWRVPYELGVRVHSNSWGAADSSYTIEYV